MLRFLQELELKFSSEQIHPLRVLLIVLPENAFDLSSVNFRTKRACTARYSIVGIAVKTNLKYIINASKLKVPLSCEQNVFWFFYSTLIIAIYPKTEIRIIVNIPRLHIYGVFLFSWPSNLFDGRYLSLDSDFYDCVEHHALGLLYRRQPVLKNVNLLNCWIYFIYLFICNKLF